MEYEQTPLFEQFLGQLAEATANFHCWLGSALFKAAVVRVPLGSEVLTVMAVVAEIPRDKTKESLVTGTIGNFS